MENENRKEVPASSGRGFGGRGPGGHGMRGSGEKAKNFKSAISRLFKELKSFKVIIVIATILAIGSSILSILAPNKLSDLTDEIQAGLVIDRDNIQELAEKIMSELNEFNTQSKMQDISGTNALQDVEEQKIMDSDIEDKTNIDIPENLVDVIFKDIEIDGIVITPKEQYEFIKQMSSMGDITNSENVNITELYSKIDEMPESIKEVIKPKMDMDKIKTIITILAMLYICSAIFSYIQSVCMAHVSNKFAKGLRTRISNKINKLPLKYFDKHQIGDTLSRVTNDVDTIAQSMNQSLGGLVSNVVLLLGTIIMMFYTNWILALTAIFASLIGFVGMFAILGKSQKYFVARQVELGKLNGHIEEIYSGLNVVKVYNGKKEADKKFKEYNKKVCEANLKSQFLSGLMRTNDEFYW